LRTNWLEKREERTGKQLNADTLAAVMKVQSIRLANRSKKIWAFLEFAKFPAAGRFNLVDIRRALSLQFKIPGWGSSSSSSGSSRTPTSFTAAAARACSREGILEEWEGAGGRGKERSGNTGSGFPSLMYLPEVRAILRESEACGFKQSEIRQLVLAGSSAWQRPLLFAEMPLHMTSCCEVSA
jgi:hypothetical protein